MDGECVKSEKSSPMLSAKLRVPKFFRASLLARFLLGTLAVFPMSSLIWLGLVVVVVVEAVLTHLTPKGAKPVAGTRLMKSARRVLIVGLVVAGAIGLWSVVKR
jgi:uncharacterized protein YjeT (DUF2065 family)